MQENGQILSRKVTIHPMLSKILWINTGKILPQFPKDCTTTFPLHIKITLSQKNKFCTSRSIGSKLFDCIWFWNERKEENKAFFRHARLSRSIRVGWVILRQIIIKTMVKQIVGSELFISIACQECFKYSSSWKAQCLELYKLKL
jgi:hypothetical protein